MSPGELIRQQREQRRWSQRELAAYSGVEQSRLSRYERGAAHPTWQVLARILAAKGMQPTVEATDCDMTRHAETATLRAAGVGGWHPPWGFEPEGVEPSRILAAPDRFHPDSLDMLLPVAGLLGGLAWALAGRIALRLLGVRCRVSAIEAVVFDQPVGDGASDRFCTQIFAGLAETGMQIWCPETGCYRPLVSADACADIVERSSRRPAFRSRKTSTRVLLTLAEGPRPVCVTQPVRGVLIPVLGLDGVAATTDADTVEELRRVGRRARSGHEAKTPGTSALPR